MASVSVRACLRCHEKKIRCTGHPCRNCSQAQVRCETYIRPRKTDSARAVKEAQRRTRWLENELSRRLGVDCGSIPTETPLQSIASQHEGASRNSASGTPPNRAGQALSDGSLAENNSSAPEISLLALNATGELRYLGPSSGALFANYAIALLRSNVPSSKRTRQHSGGDGSAAIQDPRAEVDNDQRPLSPKEVQHLLQSYKMWVHPLYPLLNLDRLDSLVARCSTAESSSGTPVEGHDMGIFYLVMALGATNYANTAKQLRINPSAIGLSDRTKSPTYLYSAASRFFLRSADDLRPSIKFIQMMLLVCIYSFYGPIGSSQWQLAGLAMRTAIEMGLHYTPRGSQECAEDKEERNRAFWVAYSIEITLAYNLGRPPSISQEHISTQLPAVDSPDVALGVHHIKHRQIQSRIVSQVYYGSSRGNDALAADGKIANLQSELDEWRASLDVICPSTAGGSYGPYPHSYWNRLYHGTTFVLHRASPLCPNPSDESLERCIRSAGAYIDCMVDVLRTSNVPLSWMLVQGILFAGLTMLVTARTSYRKIASRVGVPFVLVELPAWARKCSVCLAIVNERWHEDLLPELGNQFELLTDNTLSVISRELTSQGATDETISGAREAEVPLDGVSSADTQFSGMMSEPMETQFVEPLTTNVSSGLENNWDNLDLFRDVLGIDDSFPFWDMFTPQTDTSGQGQRIFLG